MALDDPESDPRPALSAADGGLWRVTTETSLYLLDLDARTVTRIPGLGAGAWSSGVASPGGAAVSPDTAGLRRDGETVPLLGLAPLRVGERMIAVIDVRGDGIATVRMTTVVHSVEREG